MNKHIKNFLETIDNGEQTGSLRWKTSKGDSDFFNVCAKHLNSLGVKLVLDMACGKGEFVNICNTYPGIVAYGITPDVDEGDFFYNGTFESILTNQNLLNDVKFDCISIQNTLHGKSWKDDELIELLNFMKKHSKYIVISKPINNPNIELDGLKEIHKFGGSHSDKTSFHRIYEVI
jgi:hypothetical protein